MKKLATIIGLLSLMLVVTSFTTTSNIGGKESHGGPGVYSIGGKESHGGPGIYSIGGKESHGGPGVYTIGGKESHGGPL